MKLVVEPKIKDAQFIIITRYPFVWSGIIMTHGSTLAHSIA